MKKMLILFMAIGLLAACNNNKAKGGLFGGLGGNKNQNNNNRNKDDYGNKDDKNKDNNNDFGNNKGGSWSSSDRNAFLRECKTSVADSPDVPDDLCSCVLEKLEKEFTDLNDLNARGTEEEGKRLSTECLSGRKTNPDDRGNGSGGWTKEEEQNWMKLCMTGNAQGDKLCPCVLQKMEKKYPTFEEANRLGTKEEGKQWALECLNEMGGNNNNNNDDNNGKGGWTNEQFQQYSHGCATAAQRNFGYSPQQANSYCDCLTKKVEQQYTFEQAARLTAQDFQTAEWNNAKVECQPRN